MEYALLLAFVGGGIVVAANTLSNAIEGELEAAADCINGDDPTCVND